MMLSLEEVKGYLKIDYDDEDNFIKTLIKASEKYIKSACGEDVNLSDERAKIIALIIISDWYDDRILYNQNKVKHVISSMLVQLSLEAECESD